jgi:hypothetical protein
VSPPTWPHGQMVMYGAFPDPESPRNPWVIPDTSTSPAALQPLPGSLEIKTMTTAEQALKAMGDRAAWLEGQLAQAKAWQEELELIKRVLKTAAEPAMSKRVAKQAGGAGDGDV